MGIDNNRTVLEQTLDALSNAVITSHVTAPTVDSIMSTALQFTGVLWTRKIHRQEHLVSRYFIGNEWSATDLIHFLLNIGCIMWSLYELPYLVYVVTLAWESHTIPVVWFFCEEGRVYITKQARTFEPGCNHWLSSLLDTSILLFVTLNDIIFQLSMKASPLINRAKNTFLPANNRWRITV